MAFRVGESEDIVVETGLYNLTQNERLFWFILAQTKWRTICLYVWKARKGNESMEYLVELNWTLFL